MARQVSVWLGMVWRGMDYIKAPMTTTWLTIKEAATYAKTSKGTIYKAVRGGHLKAARINERGDFRFCEDWLDDWLRNSTIVTTQRITPKS